MTLEEAREALKRAEANAKTHDAELAAVARDFARGDLSFEDLAAAAKRATNARHAVGRAKKWTRDAKEK